MNSQPRTNEFIKAVSDASDQRRRPLNGKGTNFDRAVEEYLPAKTLRPAGPGSESPFDPGHGSPSNL